MIDYKLKNYDFKRKPIYDFFKRTVDILLSSISLLLLSWLFLVIAILIKCDDGGPVFFAHKRVGRKGKDIHILKFRSMVVNADELISELTEEQMKEYKENFKIKDDPRVTKIGKFLRKTCLDELPQLINLFKGDITLIGPRPILEEETQLYGEHRNLLLQIKPGITGVWAAYGRGIVPYAERIKMELYYVCKRSVGLDIKLFVKTLASVLTSWFFS